MRGILLLTISLLALLTAQWWMAGPHDGAVFRGELHDGDSYMRLVRVTRLLQGGDWRDQGIPRANAPHGHALHWSRPLDGLLVVGAAALTPSLGDGAALHQAGVWQSPLLHVLTLLALLWAARPLLPPSGLLWLGLLFPLQLLLDYQFTPGRPDHHALIRALGGRPLLWAAILALPLGVLVWAGVEGLTAALAPAGAMMQTTAVLVFAFGWLPLSALFSGGIPNDRRADTKCPQDAMARYLAARFTGQRRILSYMTIGPAILYRGQHEVIATPYFRNAQGGRDTLAFFRAMEVETAFEIADRRRIVLVPTCPPDRESRLYRAGRPRPVWPRPLELPAELGQWYRLYRVLL